MSMSDGEIALELVKLTITNPSENLEKPMELYGKFLKDIVKAKKEAFDIESKNYK